MSKKKVILTVVAFVLIAIAAYVGVRLKNRWTDINGVTTVYERNTVYMNAKTGKEFYAGSGKLSVGEGENIHVEYALEGGSFDLAFCSGSNALDKISNSDLDNLSASGDVYGKSGISGKGSIYFEASPGEYTVYFKQHGAVGTVTVTAQAKGLSR